MERRPVELSPAPFFGDIAAGPEGGAAHWAPTSDGLRIRVGHWRPEGPARGTVLLFPGRTEYIEKYGGAAAGFAARGYATLAVDWRGQGLAGRLIPDARLGHVNKFADYQKDVEAALAAARLLDLPRPYFLIGHSMGGAIGLRAAMEGLDVRACVFTGPMWGIEIPPVMRPLARFLGAFGPVLGLSQRLVPTTSPEQYVLANPFENNTLTSDPQMYRAMQDQLAAHPELAIGGPTVQWLTEGLKECAALAARPSPELPCLTLVGDGELIVDVAAARARMARWPGGALEMVAGGRHEVMMEAPKIRAQVFARITGFFDSHAG